LGAFALILVYVLALGAMKLANLWMLIFGSIVFAVVLRSIADPLVRYFKIPDGAAVAGCRRRPRRYRPAFWEPNF
jgi:hypothetical protein